MKRIITNCFAVALAFSLGGLLTGEIRAAEAEETYEEIEETLGQVPAFLRAYPESGIAGAWEAMKGVEMNPDTALSAKEKELVALAIAASIPCEYCVYFHRSSAEAKGASEQEMREALAIAATTRHWSTILNGSDVDLEEFKRETDEIMNHLAEEPTYAGREEGAGAAVGPLEEAMSPQAREAYADIEATLGQVPSFLRAYPDIGVAGAWEALKGVEMNPDTALSTKQKQLIGFAVAASIPCDYCVYFHRTSAEANGANEQEKAEALAVAASVRHWSTIVNGSEIEFEEFKQETDEIIAHLGEQRAEGD